MAYIKMEKEHVQFKNLKRNISKFLSRLNNEGYYWTGWQLTSKITWDRREINKNPLFSMKFEFKKNGKHPTFLVLKTLKVARVSFYKIEEITERQNEWEISLCMVAQESFTLDNFSSSMVTFC